jgi:PKD repeat protein
MVYLQFLELDLANSADRIDIYDGPSTDSPLLLSLYGSSIPTTPILSSGSSITVQQISDAHINGDGFLLKWQCIKTNTSPTANFISLDSISCSNTIKFYNKSKEADQSIWYFGDGQNSIEQHPLHTYAQNGTYNIKLIVSNSHGTDSIIKSNYVVINQIAPPIIADEIRCSSGTVEFNTQTNNTIYWHTSSSANLPIDSGAQFITPIIQNTTSYYVSQRHYSSPLSVGKADSASNGSYLNLGENKGLLFDVNNTSTLISIDVYANSNGGRSFLLFNSAGELIYNTQKRLVVGKNTIDLNWNLNQGISYKICTNSNPNLFYNTSNVAFPYSDANNNIIIKDSDYPNVYLYFYNWKLKNKSCISPRVEVLAIISDTLKPKSLFDISANGLSVEFTNNAEYADT